MEGAFHPSDATWNYMDIPHAEFVHGQIYSNVTAVSDRFASVVAFLKLGWLKIPLSITNYSSNPLSMTYYSTWLVFVLIVESEAEEIQPNLSKVTTTYQIGSARFFKCLHPLIRWFLKKNYNVLMLSDIPMREQRGILRGWGLLLQR